MVKSRELPGYSELFLDHIDGSPRVQRFLPSRPERETLIAHAVRATRKPVLRQELCEILDENAERFGSGARARSNIRKLAEPGTTVVLASLTPGVLGGTLGQWLTCLTTAALCAHLSDAGLSSIPLVSIQGEGSELSAESSVCLLDSDSKLIRISAEEARTATPSVLLEKVRTLATAGPESEVMEALQRTHEPASDTVEASASFLAAMTDELGIVLLGEDNPRFQALASKSGPTWRNDTLRWTSLLQRSILKLREAGYALPDQDSPEGRRGFVGDRFLEPGLFPVAAIVSGDADIYGLAVMQSLFSESGDGSLLIWPRACATVVDSRSRKTLEKYGVKLEDLFSGWEEVLRRTGLERSEGDVAAHFDALAGRVRTRTEDLETMADENDLKAEVAAARQKLLYQLEKIRERFLSSSRQRRQAASRQLERACNTLAPGGGLQERQMGTLHFLLRYSPAVVRMIHDRLDFWNHEHQLLNLD